MKGIEEAKAPAASAPKLVPVPEGSDSEPRSWFRFKFRHLFLVFLFLIVCVIPTVLSTWYLAFRTADQFHSQAAFSVRSEDFSNPLDALSAFTQVGKSSASDNEILREFIHSQPIVRNIDTRLGLRDVFNRDTNDTVFSLGDDPSIEDLVDYWNRMVKVDTSSSRGVLSLRVFAFQPDDAHRIAELIIEESSFLVNELSKNAREDAMRYAARDVEDAETRLRDIRRRVQTFRIENQIIDPEANVESQMSVISTLQTELSRTLIERSELLGTTAESDQRITRLDRRIAAIRAQISAERALISDPSSAGQALSGVIGDYEELLVELEFAKNTYVSALATRDQAKAEARRQNRYIAVHISPTLAEESLYPQRWLWGAVVAFCAFALWAVFALIFYNVRDRS